MKNVESDKTKRAPVIAALCIILYFNAIYIYGAMDYNFKLYDIINKTMIHIYI